MSQKVQWNKSFLSRFLSWYNLTHEFTTNSQCFFLFFIYEKNKPQKKNKQKKLWSNPSYVASTSLMACEEKYPNYIMNLQTSNHNTRVHIINSWFLFSFFFLPRLITTTRSVQVKSTPPVSVEGGETIVAFSALRQYYFRGNNKDKNSPWDSSRNFCGQSRDTALLLNW